MNEQDNISAKPKMTKAEQAELLRRTVDTVGKTNQPGEKIQKVISVGMLSEGWDAKTVTHIMGLRGFLVSTAVRTGGGTRIEAHILRVESGNGTV